MSDEANNVIGVILFVLLLTLPASYVGRVQIVQHLKDRSYGRAVAALVLHYVYIAYSILIPFTVICALDRQSRQVLPLVGGLLIVNCLLHRLTVRRSGEPIFNVRGL